MAARGVEGVVLESVLSGRPAVLDSTLQQTGLGTETPVSVLCVPPNLSDSIYLLSQDPLSFTGKFCSGKGYETYSP